MAIGAIIGGAAAASGINAASQGVVSPAMTGLGNLISGGTWQQSGNQIAQNKFVSQEADKVRAFEKMMSDTSYQRAVEDMKKAGLNPAMLYASGGNGASTPSAGPTTGSTVSSGQAMDLLGSVAPIINAFNNARYLDHKTGHDQLPNYTTEKVYNALGQLVRATTRTSRK